MDRLPVPLTPVLSCGRWRRCTDPGCARACEGFPAKAGLPARRRRECRDADGQPNAGFHLLARVSRSRPNAFAEAGITHTDVDHLMIYDACAHLPIYGLDDLGFVPRGEAGASSSSATPPPMASCRSTPMAATYRTCIPACTAYTRCRRACARCAALPRPNPRRQDPGLQRRRRHVRRLRHAHHVE
jgi:hypothetical protein